MCNDFEVLIKNSWEKTILVIFGEKIQERVSG